MTTQPVPLLGPHRLSWCREHLRGFADMEAAVKDADDRAKRAERIAKGLPVEEEKKDQ